MTYQILVKKLVHRSPEVGLRFNTETIQLTRSYVNRYLNIQHGITPNRPDSDLLPNPHTNHNITLHGYLNQIYQEITTKLPENDTPNKVATNLPAVIQTAAIRYGNAKDGNLIAHKFIWSVCSETTSRWKKTNKNSEQMLRDIVENTLRHYSETYINNEEIGYAIAIHHTESIHAHVTIMTHSSKGHTLPVSCHSKLQGKDIRVDILSDLSIFANSSLKARE